MKYAAYVRAPNTDADLDRQREELVREFRRRGIDPDGVLWFADAAGDEAAGRPALDRLRAEVAAGRVSRVVLPGLDRLSRRSRDCLEVLSDWAARGVAVETVDPPFLLDAGSAKAFAALLGGLLDGERDYLRGRRREGIDGAKRENRYKGRKPGATKGNPERARELSAQGRTAAEIAAELGVSERTVARYLRRGEDGPSAGAGGPPPG